MKALYSWEIKTKNDKRESDHPADLQLGEGVFEGMSRCRAMEQIALRGKNFVRIEWTCQLKERVRSKATLRNLGAGLNVRGVPVKVS